MTDAKPSPPPVDRVLDLDFLEARAKLLDLAAFLDRIDRAQLSSPVTDGGGATRSVTEGESSTPADHRLAALRRALPILLETQPNRAERIQRALSDPTDHPIDHATTQGATGAWPGPTDGSGGPDQ